MTDSETPATPAGVPAFGPWLIAGTPVDEPYPCRCHESKYGRCSPAFCPCSGRIDYENVPPDCCARINTPARAAQAQAAYELKRRQQRAEEQGG